MPQGKTEDCGEQLAHDLTSGLQNNQPHGAWVTQAWKLGEHAHPAVISNSGRLHSLKLCVFYIWEFHPKASFVSLKGNLDQIPTLPLSTAPWLQVWPFYPLECVFTYVDLC